MRKIWSRRTLISVGWPTFDGFIAKESKTMIYYFIMVLNDQAGLIKNATGTV
jgi:hypothetical protein